MAAATGLYYNVPQWIEEHKSNFLPPVCNKMMHNAGQMKLFFVGGPNQRKDYHVDCGEELFLQLKGHMTLKIVEQGQHKDVHIKEGQMFLLPGRIPHSPQRFENTVGLVLERERHPDTELDGLRYFVEENGTMTLQRLYEKWFYCTDLGTQLAPIIQSFFASDQYRTGKPIPGDLPETCPVELDEERRVEAPFNFRDWINSHKSQLQKEAKVQVFDGSKYQFQVYVMATGVHQLHQEVAEIWIWQQDGTGSVTVDGKTQKLDERDSFLVPKGKRAELVEDAGSCALVCWQDPRTATTWPQQ